MLCQAVRVAADLRHRPVKRGRGVAPLRKRVDFIGNHRLMCKIGVGLPLLQLHALRLHPLSLEKQLPMFLHQPGGLPLQGLFIQRRSSPPGRD